ncbi:MAG: tetratricopeptide repeat protein [Candidatus Marinimicrobia bacterium]|nr:tetratricopeptide repeat protein [Candidatus Neomarinimicrobiota bacterium]
MHHKHFFFLIFGTIVLLFSGCERSPSLYDRYVDWIHTPKEQKLAQKIDDMIFDIQKQGKATLEALTDLMDLSRLGAEMGDADRAFEAGLRAQSMAEVMYGPKDEKTLRVYLQLADHAMMLMEPRLAENYLNKAMTAATLAHHENYLLLADIYTQYAEVHQAFQKLDDAENLYFKAIGLVEKVDSNNVKIAEIETRLGILMEEKEKVDLAEKFYRKALAREVNQRGASSIQAAALYNNLASVCFITSRPDEAINYLHKALKIWKKQENSTMKQAEIHSNLAEIYRTLGDMDSAKKEYKIVLRLMKDIPESSYLYSSLLMNLSNYYIQLDQREKAEELRFKAQNLQKEQQNRYLENVSILKTKFNRIPGMEIK